MARKCLHSLLYREIHLMAILLIYGTQCVKIETSYEVVRQSSSKAGEEVLLPCVFNYSTPAGMLGKPTTDWNLLNNGTVIASVNSSGILNPGSQYAGRVRLLNNDAFDSSIYFIGVPAVASFSCVVTLLADVPTLDTKHVVVITKEEEVLPEIHVRTTNRTIILAVFGAVAALVVGIVSSCIWLRKFSPKMKIPLVMTSGQEGIDLDVCCPAGGRLAPTYAWWYKKDGQKDFVPMKADDHYKISDVTGIMKIMSPSTRDTGYYKCRAQNLAGSAECIAKVDVQQNGTSSNITSINSQLKRTRDGHRCCRASDGHSTR